MKYVCSYFGINLENDILIWKFLFYRWLCDFCVSGKIDNNNGVSMSNRVLCD